jgi:hypothetical protein
VQDWLGLLGALSLTLGGLACIGIAAGWKLEAWNTQQTWSTSVESRRAAQTVAAPTPIWLPDIASQPSGNAVPFLTDDPYRGLPPPVVVLGPPSEVHLLDAKFLFLDPPEPGAHPRLSIDLRVDSNAAGPSLAVSIPSDWFDGFTISTTQPPSTPDASADASSHRVVFSGVGPGPFTLVFDAVATGERVDAPSVRIERADTGALIGEVHPQTLAPRPRPGRVSLVRIPPLGLTAAVVPTAWEPPAFVVGQVRESSFVTLGNTVLVGHLGGAAGDVFKDLDQLRLGDTVVAVSRGVEFSFIVSDKQTLPADNSQPTSPALSPRLTLMTCTGTWDPVGRNYSDRLWVTAELPPAAAQTIIANSTRPPTPVPSPTLAPAQAAAPLDDGESLRRGLGADRSRLDATLGPPLGETAGKLVVYRQGSAEYHVGFTPDPPRAQLLEVLPVGTTTTLSIPVAVERAHMEFPVDAMPRSQAPDGTSSLVVERWSSSALGRVLDTSGDFVAAYARDASGLISRVVIATGDNPDSSLQAASR